MKKYEIQITETYSYGLDIEANNKKEAIEKAKEYYEEADDGVTGVADACSFEDVKFSAKIKTEPKYTTRL